MATALGISGANAQGAFGGSYRTNYLNITGDATTTVKNGNGILVSICINTGTATETITIFDSTTGSGTKIGTITVPASPQPACLLYGVNFTFGLTIVTATAASDITVAYQ